MHRNGFTLVELLVVIAVIAILAALLIPIIGLARKAAADAKCQARIGEIKAALDVYRNANGVYPERFNGSVGSDVYSTSLATGAGAALTGKPAKGLSESVWQAVNAALKQQLATVDPDNFRIVAADPDWKPTGRYIVDPYGTGAGDFKVFRYRPSKYYSLTSSGGASTTIAIDSDNPPNPDGYQLWSCGWNRKDEYGEKLYSDGAVTRKGDDQTNWSGK